MVQPIVFDDAANVIRACLTGDVTSMELLELLDCLNDYRSAERCNKILIDVSGVLKTPGVAGLYEFAGSLSYDVYVALTVNSNNNADFMFLENTALNRGRNLRLFRDEQDALSWLNASAKTI